MLYLGPVNSSEAKPFFEKSSIEYNKDSICVLCKDGEEVLGFCLFDLDAKKITVKYIEPLTDIGLADGILRSSLHVAAERNILDAFYEDTVPKDLLNKIGFIKNEEEKRLDIDKLFNSSCNCG